MIKAHSLQTEILIELPPGTSYRIERCVGCDGPWQVLTDSGYVLDGDGVTPIPVMGNYIDKNTVNGICQYRVREFANPDSEWDFTEWLMGGSVDPVGYTFGNYKSPEGSWGNIITTDDLRYTYLWGVDFRASNGASYSDAQIQFFINSALEEMERLLKIAIKKIRVICKPEKRGLQKGKDYDIAEDFYPYKRERVQKMGMVYTRYRPIISVSKFELLNRSERMLNLLDGINIDHTKGRIEFYNRPFRTNDTIRNVETAILPYGAGTLERGLNYAIDYVAGFENSDDVPSDLRQIIGKVAAVSLLNNVGRGLMSGFSSSSVSMDGVSESFSSTQSATSAYYGADIKEYKDDIDRYIAENKMRWGHVTMGAL